MKGQQAIGTLVIFIALVITAALASYVLVTTTNALQSKSLAVASKTMEKSTYAFNVRSVEGLTTDSEGDINYIMFAVELAPGSGDIDLQDVTVIWSAAAGSKYHEYSFAGATSTLTLDTTKLADSNESNIFSNTVNDNQFYIESSRSHWDNDRYVESGELYVLVIDLNAPGVLNEGEDWTLTLRAPYIQDTVVTGYAPEVLQKGQIVKLK